MHIDKVLKINLFLLNLYIYIFRAFRCKTLGLNCTARLRTLIKITGGKCIRTRPISLPAFDTDLRYVALVGVVHRGWFYK